MTLPLRSYEHLCQYPDEVLLPCQYGNREQRGQGARGLIGAVLEDAIETLRRKPLIKNYQISVKRRQAYEDAEVETALEWLQSDQAAHSDYFSFLDCCYHLGIDPEWLREKLGLNKEKHRKC